MDSLRAQEVSWKNIHAQKMTKYTRGENKKKTSEGLSMTSEVKTKKC